VKRSLSALAVLVSGALLVLFVPLLWLASEAPARPVCGFIDGGLIVTAPDPQLAADGRLTAEQSFFASVIVSEVVRRQLPPDAAVIALATAITETGLKNSTAAESDLDSSGLFQQRPLSYPNINPLDPVQATDAFLDQLQAVPDWQHHPIWWVAAEIQRPAEAFRQRYDGHVAAALGIVQALWDKAGTLPSCGRGAVLAGNYTLPVPKELFDAHPDWLTAPHHTYPAADIPVPAGTQVFAVSGGRVIASPAGGDCGQGVIIAGDDGVIYTYCHGTVAIPPEGTQVAVGELVMISGWTGHVEPAGPAGAHLHLQMRLGADGPLVCPQPALAAWSRGEAVDPLTLPTGGCIS
jgi:murein DD-endopeptidase MepM/ murein hydrolase activator NlpD